MNYGHACNKEGNERIRRTTAQNACEGAVNCVVSSSLTKDPAMTGSGSTPAKLNKGVRVPALSPNEVSNGVPGCVSKVYNRNQSVVSIERPPSN